VRPARWIYTTEELREAVRQARSYRQVLLALGLAPAGGGAYSTLKRRIKELGLDTQHFTGQGWSRGRSNVHPERRLPLDSLLTCQSSVQNLGWLKRRLISEGRLVERCAVCAMEPTWNGRPLVLRLDHINGVRDDNRLSNLRLVCPNCDSQLPTFAGRNRGKPKR